MSVRSGIVFGVREVRANVTVKKGLRGCGSHCLRSVLLSAQAYPCHQSQRSGCLQSAPSQHLKFTFMANGRMFPIPRDL